MESLLRKASRKIAFSVGFIEWADNPTVFKYIRRIGKSDYQLRHVCPSLHKEQLDSRCTDFHEIWRL